MAGGGAGVGLYARAAVGTARAAGVGGNVVNTVNRVVNSGGNTPSAGDGVRVGNGNSATQNVAVGADGVRIPDGIRMPISDALDAADGFLGSRYTQTADGRFISADGSRQVRMGDGDILGLHGGGSHINLQNLTPSPTEARPNRMVATNNIHVFLVEDVFSGGIQ